MVIYKNNILKNKRIFISGGAGVIGTSLVEKLNNLGNEIFVGDLKPKPKKLPKNVVYRQGDLNFITKKEIEEFKPEYFFHLAATFERAEESYEFWNENFKQNINLSNHLMTILKDSKSLKKVIFASSYLIYDSKIYTSSTKPEKSVRINENELISPRNTCGAAKLFHENQLKFLVNFDHVKFDSVSARIFRVYGKNSQDIISRWIRSLLKNEEIIVYNKEDCFDYIFADDVAEGLIKLSDVEISGIINLGNDKSRSIEEVLEILKNYFPKMKVKFSDFDYPYEASQADMSKFKEKTGFCPMAKLEDNIPKIIEFEKEKNNEKIQVNPDFNILITSISKKISLLKLVKKANERLGNLGKVIGADSDNNCIGRYFVDSFWEIPPYEEISIKEIISYCMNNNISCIIPTSDGELSFYAKYKNEFLEKGIHILVSDYKKILICLDKMEFYKRLENLKFPVIKTSSNIDDINEEYFVIKERYANFGIQSNQLKITKQEVNVLSQKFDNPIFQPFVEGEEFSIDIYVDKKFKAKGGIIRTRENIVNGESQITKSIENKKLENMCLSLVEKLELYGHTVMQVIIDNKGDFNIIECNNRFGGASSLSQELGLDTFYWFLLEVNDINLNEYPFIRSKNQKRQIRYPENLILF